MYVTRFKTLTKGKQWSYWRGPCVCSAMQNSGRLWSCSRLCPPAALGSPLTVRDVKVRQIPPKPLKERARKMRAEKTGGRGGGAQRERDRHAERSGGK